MQCGYHGMRFHPDGTCEGVPGQDAPPGPGRPCKRFGDRTARLIWIWMGDPARAGAALVPDAFWFANPEWATASGYHHMACEYRPGHR